MKIGIIREGKVPPDSRVPLIPEQCRVLREEQGMDLVVQASEVRCFPNDDYRVAGVPVVASVDDCDLLLGVKEVPVNELVPAKTYFFFSHTIKEQPYNRKLLRTILEKDIRLIDYEVLTDDAGMRLIAFGRFAGMVGAHNAMWTYGRRTGMFSLPRMKDCLDYDAARDAYHRTAFPSCRVVLTGTGRVANGAAEVLDDMGFHRMAPAEYLSSQRTGPVYTQLAVCDYAQSRDGSPCTEQTYFLYPERFVSQFDRFLGCSHIMINGIYWDPRAPAFFTLDEMRAPDFSIQVIADVTCDIAPDSSVPSTLRPSTIADPVYGFDPHSGKEAEPFQPGAIDVMAIDNLPNEMPRDASEAFGAQFIDRILPELFKEDSAILERATIAHKGKLGVHFAYLEEYVKGNQS
ncbi:MAG: NAD(P)-dependent oxidoreductase [Saprospiraceae bacterium]|nr:NAD(P)-dependent oxidoreductase [Saprospiraceae bacterium]